MANQAMQNAFGRTNDVSKRIGDVNNDAVLKRMLDLERRVKALEEGSYEQSLSTKKNNNFMYGTR